MGRILTFGDGGTSTSATAAHTYAAPGTYTVCLIVFNSCGNDTLCSNVTVLCTPAVSGFTHSGGLAHSFTNTSTSASSWLWTFGDGGTSTLANPSHTYAAPGTYTACLIASNACDSDTVCTTFTLTCTPGVPSFLFSNLGGGNWFFLNTSGGSATYLWQFGDGGTSTTASPNHTYSSPGTYNVCLIRTDICGSDTTCQTITVCAWTTSLFSHTTSSLTANFTDLSTGGPTTWSWDFGDGSTSTAASPSHTYAAPGTYTVCLTAANTCGGSDTCTTVTVSCVGAPAAGFGWTDVGLGNVSFSNTSTGLPTLASSWDFGDGGTSTAASPTHAYALAGTYVACLTVADGCGSNSTCDTVYVIEGGSNAASPSIFQLSLHPNPTEGVFTVSGQWPDLHGNFTLQVLDATGRLVAESQETALQGEVWAQTDLSGVAAGLYQVRLITAMGNAHLLVMKQ
jgi:PKD repeat protein